MLAVLVVLCVVFSSLAFVACNSDEEPHTHTYGQEWASDATGHWHAADCDATDECAAATTGFAEHEYVAGVCSVCQYADPDYVPALALNDNGVATVNATAEGAKYSYTGKINGTTLAITWTDANAKVMVNGQEITSGYEFTLNSGDTITFVMSTVDGTAASYEVTLGEPAPAVELGEYELGVGTKTVSDDGWGTKYTFTAPATGTYSISWTSDNADIYEDPDGSSTWIEASGYEFTLEEGETITFLMATVNWEADSYDVTIAVVA